MATVDLVDDMELWWQALALSRDEVRGDENAGRRGSGGSKRASSIDFQPRRPLHSRKVDEGHGYLRHYPGQATEDDDPRQEGAMPAGQGESPVPGAANMLWVSDSLPIVFEWDIPSDRVRRILSRDSALPGLPPEKWSSLR